MFQINDEMYKALGELGFTGALPDRVYAHLGSLGCIGAMNDRLECVGGLQQYVDDLLGLTTILVATTQLTPTTEMGQFNG